MAPVLAIALIVAIAIAVSIGYNHLYNPLVEPRRCPHPLADGINVSVFKAFSPADRTNGNIFRRILAPEAFPSECFFGDNYFEARRLFLAQAKKVPGAEMLSFEVEDVNHYTEDGSTKRQSSSDKKYTTDVLILRGDPKRQVWHLSGTHGGEGYAGSSAQVTISSFQICIPLL
jgi:hypothetical protein